MGRPTSYKPEYCEQLIVHCGEGLSFESFAGVVGAHRDSLYEWVKVYPEFSDAKKKARAASLLFLDKVGRGLMTGKIKGNVAAWIFTVSNRHPDLYSNNPSSLDEAIEGVDFVE